MSGPGNVSMDAARGKKSSAPLMMKSILLKPDGGDNSIIVEIPPELVARRFLDALFSFQTMDRKTGKPAPFALHLGTTRAMVLDTVTDELVAAGEKASTMFDLKMKPSEFRKAQVRATVEKRLKEIMVPRTMAKLQAEYEKLA